MATSSIEKAAHKNPDKYIGLTGLKHQLKNRLWSQKIVRIGSIGEFARLPKEQALEVVKTIKEAGLIKRQNGTYDVITPEGTRYFFMGFSHFLNAIQHSEKDLNVTLFQ